MIPAWKKRFISQEELVTSGTMFGRKLFYPTSWCSFLKNAKSHYKCEIRRLKAKTAFEDCLRFFNEKALKCKTLGATI